MRGLTEIVQCQEHSTANGDCSGAKSTPMTMESTSARPMSTTRERLQLPPRALTSVLTEGSKEAASETLMLGAAWAGSQEAPLGSAGHPLGSNDDTPGVYRNGALFCFAQFKRPRRG